jgi:enterochelin esterase-like enzyme
MMWPMRVSNLMLVLFGLTLLAACGPAAAPVDPPATATASPAPHASPTARPAPSATPTAVCSEDNGVSQLLAYDSPILAQPVRVWVYQPPCAASLDRPLPILILLHGKPYTETHWPGLGLVEVYETGLAAGRWGPTLIVAPHAPEPLFSSSDGGPNSYEQELLEGVLPFVADWASTLGQPGELSLAGISRGGVWALETGLRHPDRFVWVGGISPALAVNYARPAYDPLVLAPSTTELPAHILLLAGEDDWARPHTERLAGLLQGKADDLRLEIVPGNHSDPTWSAALPRILAYLVPSR